MDMLFSIILIRIIKKYFIQKNPYLYFSRSEGDFSENERQLIVDHKNTVSFSLAEYSACRDSSNCCNDNFVSIKFWVIPNKFRQNLPLQKCRKTQLNMHKGLYIVNSNYEYFIRIIIELVIFGLIHLLCFLFQSH